MTQEDLDILFQITSTIHTNNQFGNNENRMLLEETQKFVSMQLAINLGIYTIPIGSDFGFKITKEKFDNYWNNIK